MHLFYIQLFNSDNKMNMRYNTSGKLHIFTGKNLFSQPLFLHQYFYNNLLRFVNVLWILCPFPCLYTINPIQRMFQQSSTYYLNPGLS